MKSKAKKSGQVFTPKYIVDEMLDYVGYFDERILRKHIIDNSCGDGAFLKSIVKRYCEEAQKVGLPAALLKQELATFIHGIDIDKVALEQCLLNLNSVSSQYGIENVEWDLRNENTLTVDEFDGKMDFVVGNPPYVRVHNLDSSYNAVKKFRFASGGMTDLYLVFFELGFKMLSETGRLCYITPSSWLNSVAAKELRRFIIQNKNLVSLTDLEHFQAFENATTYTIISLFAKNNRNTFFDYYTFNRQTLKREFKANISIFDCNIDGHFYLSDKSGLELIKAIKNGKSYKYVSVKNGFATLADSVFIGNDIPMSKITIKVLKASTGKWYQGLFPYDKKGKLLPTEIVFSEPQIASYFEAHKAELLKGKDDNPFYYGYGRTQALADVWKEKIAINTLLRTEKDLKIERVGTGQGLYSGLYIITNSNNVSFDYIKDILNRKEFTDYIKLLKKYKSGGYYTFNSKDIEQYINYHITLKAKKDNVDKSNFFGQDIRVL